MNKIVKNMILVAAAAMGFTACQKEFQEDFREDVQPAEETVVVKFVAQSADTKTSVDVSGDAPVFAWNETETFAVLEQTDALAKATSVDYEKVDGKANINAEFTANAGKGTYQYVTVYPESGYVSAASINEATLRLPAEQTMAAESYDPAADLMVSKVVTTDAQPTEAQQVQFTRLAAVVKMSLKNFGLELGDNVQKVIFTAEGKNLAGEVAVNLANPELEGAAVSASSSSVTVNTTSAGDVYFTVLPTVLEAGDAYSVVVLTDKKLYVKQGTIPAEKSLAFEAGNVTRFNVNMSGVAPSDKWVLVKDASTLKQGDVVTIAAKDYNYVVGKQGSNYPIASYTEVVKFGDYLYHPVADANTAVDNRIQHYTLMKRDNERVAFDFYNAEDYEGDTSVGFVYATGSNYSPKLQTFCDKNTLFDVSVADGVASITANEITSSYKYWRYYHSSSASSRKFDFTSSVPTDSKYFICLYKLEGATGSIPVVEANVTVPDSDESVVIAEEGAQTPTAIEEVVFNYVGDWAISATASESWLSVSYTDGVLSYTAEANAGAPREAVVTITAAREGSDDLTWTFNVLQKGAPIEISIKEFRTKSKDLNTTYKLTGKISKTATGTGAWTIVDEEDNQVKIGYFKTDVGVNVDGNVDLKVGDIVTFTTVVTGSTGTSTCGNSANPSIYKGHYGLAASAGLAAEYTGGTVEINVETYSNGAITLPENVVGSMEENDFATFSYDGGNAATVTFADENTTSDAKETVVTFTYGLVTVTVTAEQGINPANRVGWNLVTDAKTLAAGDQIVIVALNSDKVLGNLASSSTATSVSNIPAVDVDKSGNVVYDVEKADAMVFTLAAGNIEGTFALQFTHKDTDYYLNAPSSGLKGRKVSDGTNDDTSFEITIDSETGDATIKNARPKVVKFNNATGTAFLAYSPTATNASKSEFAVAIYKK